MRKGVYAGLSFVLAAAVSSSGAWGQTTNVVGGPSMNNPYRLQHVPFFNKELPATSVGTKLGIKLIAQDQMGLKGPEVVGLLAKGVIDIAYVSFNYIAGDDPRMEGIDLPGMTIDTADARKAAEAYKPVIEKALREQHNAKLLNISPVSLQVVFCKQPISKLSDFKGLKVRTFGVAMAEYFKALGAVPVNMAFVEVLPALQRGVVDCAITSTINGNTGRWWEVTRNIYKLGMGWGMVFFAANLDWWNKQDQATKDALAKEFKAFEDKLWQQAESDIQDGVNCNTGEGKCADGIVVPAAQRMKFAAPSDADKGEHKRILQETVLPGWAKRCGAACSAAWNETIGKAVGLVAATAR